MNSIKLIALSVATLLTLSLSGCGGSSDSSDGTSSDGTSSGDISSLTPIISFSCEATQEYAGTTYVFKLGANGNLACETTYGVPTLAFESGVNEMSVNQLISVSKFNTTLGNGTYTINLQDGTETIVVTSSEYGSANCVNTYDVPTPIAVYDASDLQSFDITGYQRINTTCPDWVNADDTDDESVSGSMSTNITITETSGTVSKVSSYNSF